MALENKLVFQSVELYNTSNTKVGVIKGIVADSIEMSIDKNDVVIEDGQSLTESYNGSFTFRTINTAYESGSEPAEGQDILGGAASLISAGQQTTKSYLKFKGLGPTDITTGHAYLSGHIDVSNGRQEVVITGNIEVITASNALGS
jgi:hypothetical protein